MLSAPGHAGAQDSTPRLVAGRLPQSWIARYETGDVSARAGVLVALEKEGPRAAFFTPTLVRALRDANADIRQRAVIGLIAIRSAATQVVPVEEILAALGEVTARERVANSRRNISALAAAALAQYGAPARSLLLELLADPAPDARAQAASSLGLLGDEGREARGALTSALRDPDGTVRIQAAIALTRIQTEPPPEAVRPILLDALRRAGDPKKEEEPYASLVIAESLARVGEAQAATRHLERGLSRYEPAGIYNDDLRRAATAETLGRLSAIAREAVPALDPLLLDPSQRVRDAAEDALLKIDDVASRRLIDRARDVERRYAARPDSAALRRVPSRLRGDVQRLAHKDALVRDQAGVALFQHEPRDLVAAIPFLLARFGDEEPVQRPSDDLPSFHTPAGTAVDVLATIGAPAVEALLVVISRDDDTQDRAAEALARIGGRRAKDGLAAIVGDASRSERLRLSAAQALTRSGDPRGLDLVIAQLGRDDHWLALTSLRGVPDQRAVPALIALLKADPSYDARRVAAVLLGEIGDSRAIPALVAALTDSDWKVAEFAARSLSAIGLHSEDTLLSALDDQRADMRVQVVRSLGFVYSSGYSPGLERLTQMLSSDPALEVRLQIVLALARVGEAGTTRAVLDALKDPSADVRAAAASSLRYSGGELDTLIEALDDPDAGIRQAAFDALLARPRAYRGPAPPTLADVSAWRAWRAFTRRTIRIRGSVVDDQARPIAGIAIVAGVSNGTTITLQSYGLEDLNPWAQTDADGRFELVDAAHLLKPGEQYTVHRYNGVLAPVYSQILRRGTTPLRFSVDLDTTVVDLGQLTVAPSAK